MRHGCLHWVLMGWWWGALRLVPPACIGVACTFIALPARSPAKAAERAENGI